MTRGWRLIARKEVGDAIRNRQLYTNAALFALVFALIAYLHVDQARAGYAEPENLVGLLSGVSIVLVPAVALMLSYAAIVKRREDGQLALLLGLPHDRRDVVVGTYLGRYAVLAASLVVGVLAAAVVTLAFSVELAAVELGGYLVAAAVLGLAYVAIATCLSTLTRDQTWASIGAFVVFMLFVFAWRFVPDAAVFLVNGLEMPSQRPWWHPYVGALSPSVAYERALDLVLGGSGDRTLSAFGALVLLGWAVLAPAAGYVRFKTSDL
ncbi:ABC transporter permease subunit [Halopiger xanaduensis]|uniref:ABC-2 type transporter n=1 Tax=Halopiger xanaduensis (strain DSM 18323 / JCM 14033 / SH-6) TaxID=797210 RepID=F8D7V1_HALXS|nr:ABC transporter permease subunit [Halopiger xanaduensis]AEH36682.1 hypothetical protein Halxa_2057 [Halopiger xanaduensis SH-6]